MFGLGLRPASKMCPEWRKRWEEIKHRWRKVPVSTDGDMLEVRHALRGPRKPLREYRRHFGKRIT